MDEQNLWNRNRFLQLNSFAGMVAKWHINILIVENMTPIQRRIHHNRLKMSLPFIQTKFSCQIIILWLFFSIHQILSVQNYLLKIQLYQMPSNFWKWTINRISMLVTQIDAIQFWFWAIWQLKRATCNFSDFNYQ